jgi:hypothetical protein
MKTRILSILYVTASLALFIYAVWDMQAQNSSTPPAATPQSAPAPAPATPAPPALSYGAEEVLKLAQAKISEGTLQAFVENSRLNYDLDATGIVYLRQQGVPETVVTAMLQKSKQVIDAAQAAVSQPAVAAVPTPATPAPAPQPDSTYAAPDYSTAYVQPSPTYVYYDDYDYYPYPYLYPYPVGIYFGGGGYYHGGYHGGYYGGYHGGTFHGGGTFPGGAVAHPAGGPGRDHH